MAVLKLKQEDFETISGLLYKLCGISLQHGKEELVKARLMKRLKALGLAEFDSYLAYLKNDRSRAEIGEMVNSLTTNKTNFFREKDHFEFLRTNILPILAAGKKIRIWTAGCSSGEEPYSVAMLLSREIADMRGWDIKILATDISDPVLQRAKDGVYREESLRDIPPQYAQKCLSCIDHRRPRRYRIDEKIKGMVKFARLNLIENWPMKGPFDVIFCRNVMIYFDKNTQQALVNKFYDLLRPGGYLFIGHSESLSGLAQRFTYLQPAIYFKEQRS